MNDQEQVHAPQDQNIQPEAPQVSVAPIVASTNTIATNKPSKLASLFSGFNHPGVLLKAVVLLLSVGVVFYAGYQLAIYQTQKGDTLLPHINFTSDNSSGGNCPPGEYYGYPPRPGATTQICLYPNGIDKPVIYLYPTHTESISVQVGYKPGFIKTVPSYNEQTGWQVEAQPNGTLTNLTNGKTYPYLFWEGNPDPSLHFDMSKGFVVAGSDTKGFLQQQLVSMGLNQNETSAFIAYWLPKMEHNIYNLIHFASSEYTSVVKLNISPQPNSLLRVFMAYEPLQSLVKVSPQTFPTFQRVGFTAVEWGGTELGN